jgi:hypothetical protein
MANLIASINFGTPPIPTPPVAGKKLFLGADGKLKTIAPDGTVEGVGGASDWADITNKPTEFPPAPHTSDKITDFVPAVNDAITDLDAGTY